MHLIRRLRPAAAAGLVLAAGSAAAHTGEHTVAGFASGFTHPFAGLDHLLAMVAVGLWAVQQGGRALWAIPTAFVLAMLAGGALAGWGGALPHVETGIAVSVVVLGLVVATRRHVPVALGAAVAASFALFHGHAHGLEMPQAASPALYGLGFVTATAALHATGIAGALFGRHAIRVAGAAIAASGATLLWLA
jgi:urease accessory protein